MVDSMPARVPDLSNWKPSFRSVSDSFNSGNSEVIDQLQRQLQADFQNQPETTLNQEFQPENQNLSVADRALWEAIKAAPDGGKSVDWCAKNIPGLPGNYYSARAIVEELKKEYGE